MSDWEEDKVYRHGEVVAGLEGGFPRAYLPRKGERVFAALLTLKLNPEAPDVILVGSNREVVQAGEIFARQQDAVPTFVKIAKNEWWFRGMYRVAEKITAREKVDSYAKRAGRSDVQFVLRLMKVQEAIVSDAVALNDFVEKIAARRRTGRGQGRGLSGPERQLVETEAMRVAKQWLTEKGFEWTNVSAFESCDFRAVHNDEEWVIEVKGTTGGPESVLLTRNEVALHRSSYPRNALLVVHQIGLSDDRTKISQAGKLLSIVPWAIDDEHLKPVCFEYRLT